MDRAACGPALEKQANVTLLVLAAVACSAVASQCAGVVTNGTRPGQDYASIKMNSTSGTTATACQAICCSDAKCATWVYVPDGLYPDRPAGIFCWLKAAAIPLKGSTCDNGKPGCVSGGVNRSLPLLA